MKKLKVLCIAIAMAGPAVAKQGHDCAAIDNDIARLACYDNAFGPSQSVLPQDLTPPEIFSELRNLLQSAYIPTNGQPLIVDSEFVPDQCRLIVARFSANNDNLTAYINQMFTVDLGQLDSVGPAYGGFRFQMKRGGTATFNEFFGLVPNMRYDAQRLSIIAGNMLQSFASTGPAGGNMKVEPALTFDLTTPVSKVDEDQILATLRRLTASCGGG